MKKSLKEVVDIQEDEVTQDLSTPTPDEQPAEVSLDQSRIYRALKKGIPYVRVFSPNSGLTWDIRRSDGGLTISQMTMQPKWTEKLSPKDLLHFEKNEELDRLDPDRIDQALNVWLPK